MLVDCSLYFALLKVPMHVMLSSNFWADMCLVNGAMGPVQAIASCYHNGGAPPYHLWPYVTVLYENYSGPTPFDGSIPTCYSWSRLASCLQLSLQLA